MVSRELDDSMRSLQLQVARGATAVYYVSKLLGRPWSAVSDPNPFPIMALK